MGKGFQQAISTAGALDDLSAPMTWFNVAEPDWLPAPSFLLTIPKAPT